MTKKIASFSILLYCLVTVLVPVFILNKIIFLPLFAVSVYLLLSRPVITFAPFVVMLIFAYGFVVGVFSGADIDLARQMLLGGGALFLIYVINEFQVDMERAVKATGAIFAATMCVFSFFLMVVPGSFIGDALLDYYNANELGYYGIRNFGNLQMFMLHHRSSPFLLVPLSLFFLDFLKVKKALSLIFVMVILAAIVCSASRALMAMAVVSLSVLYFSHKSWSMRLTIMVVAVPIAAFALSYLIGETSIFSSDEQSNSIKIGHLISFFEVVDWKMLLVGNGLGAYFYTEGYGSIVSQTEITWMDSIRFVGLPLSIVLLVVLFFPARKVASDSVASSSRLIMFLYVVMSMSNPVLFNSFGFLVILWYWSIVMKGQESSVKRCQILGG